MLLAGVSIFVMYQTVQTFCQLKKAELSLQVTFSLNDQNVQFDFISRTGVWAIEFFFWKVQLVFDSFLVAKCRNHTTGS